MPTPKKIILKVLKVLNYSRFKLLNLCRFAALRQPKVPILDSYLGFQNKHKSHLSMAQHKLFVLPAPHCTWVVCTLACDRDILFHSSRCTCPRSSIQNIERLNQLEIQNIFNLVGKIIKIVTLLYHHKKNGVFIFTYQNVVAMQQHFII